jgi:hypothetical protein
MIFQLLNCSRVKGRSFGIFFVWLCRSGLEQFTKDLFRGSGLASQLVKFENEGVGDLSATHGEDGNRILSCRPREDYRMELLDRASEFGDRPAQFLDLLQPLVQGRSVLKIELRAC